MGIRRLVAGLAAALILGSCGGGDPALAPSLSLADAPLAAANPSLCESGSANAALVGGTCVQVLKDMAPERAQALAAGVTLTPAMLFDWVQTVFPQFFTGAGVDGVFLQYTYRYYAASNTFVAIDTSSNVFVLGPVTNFAIMFVAPLSSFTCSVVPSACASSTLTVNVRGTAGRSPYVLITNQLQNPGSAGNADALIGCPSSCQGQMVSGHTIALETDVYNPRNRVAFSGACSGTTCAPFVMNGDKTVTATVTGPFAGTYAVLANGSSSTAGAAAQTFSNLASTFRLTADDANAVYTVDMGGSVAQSDPAGLPVAVQNAAGSGVVSVGTSACSYSLHLNEWNSVQYPFVNLQPAAPSPADSNMIIADGTFQCRIFDASGTQTNASGNFTAYRIGPGGVSNPSSQDNLLTALMPQSNVFNPLGSYFDDSTAANYGQPGNTGNVVFASAFSGTVTLTASAMSGTLTASKISVHNFDTGVISAGHDNVAIQISGTPNTAASDPSMFDGTLSAATNAYDITFNVTVNGTQIQSCRITGNAIFGPVPPPFNTIFPGNPAAQGAPATASATYFFGTFDNRGSGSTTPVCSSNPQFGFIVTEVSLYKP